ncbi:MAG: DUF11 domain-containing protein, partial [Anaerolineales bacterium]|nr:DUF11 domain-containing protein [Anaerolineales bacterium]
MEEQQTLQWQGRRVAAIIGMLLLVVWSLVLVQKLAAQESDASLTPALQVSKTVSETAVVPGNTIQYSIVISNDGTSPAFPVMLTDTLPATLHGISAINVVGGGEYGVVGNVITWTGAVNNGTAVTLDFAAVLTDTAVPGTTVTNTVHVTGTGSLLADDAVFDVIAQPPAMLHLSKYSSQPVVFPGGTLDYTIVVSNSGSGAATGVMLTDALPAELSVVPNSVAVVGGGSYGVSGSVITWTGTISDSGGEVRLAFTAMAAGTIMAGDMITNTAVVSGAGAQLTADAAVGVQTTAYAYLPSIQVELPTPVINPIALPTTSNGYQTYKLTVSWNDVGVPGATYIVEESRSPSFNNATSQNVGAATSAVFEHAPTTDLGLYYYRVRVVLNGRTSLWSNTRSQRGIYFDAFSDPSTNWSIRREDTDDVNNSSYYENGNFVLKIGGRWDYAIASPLVAVPWSSYSIGTSVRFDPTVDNLHAYGVIFGADWNGEPCPNGDYSSCFNHYYRMLAIWYG